MCPLTNAPSIRSPPSGIVGLDDLTAFSAVEMLPPVTLLYPAYLTHTMTPAEPTFRLNERVTGGSVPEFSVQL